MIGEFHNFGFKPYKGTKGATVPWVRTLGEVLNRIAWNMQVPCGRRAAP